MNNKIFGNPETIKRAKNATSGDRTVYINWDAISELPDEYEVIITEIKFDSKKLDIDFADVGNGQWIPTPKLMYRIAEACGIGGGENSITEAIKEEIDINPMLMKGIESPVTIRLMIVGRRVRKYSTRLQEDGTELRSSVCTCDYNVWERCCESWAKEELYTDNYTKQSKYPNKYDTINKRKLHFASEMKFAHAKAETKAHEKTIRELAGMQTGYSTESLQDGMLIFAKVRRSRKILQAETAARLSALAQGQPQIEKKTQLLFGDNKQESVGDNEQEPPAFDFVESEPKKDNRLELIAILQTYEKENLIVDGLKDSVKNLLSWLNATATPENNKAFWNKAMKILKQIEELIPEEGRIDHKF